MMPLFFKELRTLLPLQILMILTNSGDIFYRPLIERLDEQAWADISSYLMPGQGVDFGVALIIFGLLVAYSLFPREHDEGTIAFLYSLPMARWRIFAAKVLAGLTVLTTACVILQITDGLLQSLNPQSFSGEQWRFDVSSRVALLHALCAGIVLCHGVLISFFRRFGLIPYAIIGWAIISLARISPAFAWLDFTNILSLEYEGHHLVLPWSECLIHCGFALVALLAAYFLWMGHAERLSRFWGRLGDATCGRVALGCGSTLVVVAFIGVLLALWDGPDPMEDDGVVPLEFEVVSVSTERFDITYPSNVRGLALPLIRQVDEIHEKLRNRLGAAVGDRIIVDMTEQSPFHEGITAWTKMHVGLLSDPDDLHLRHTFAHELVHAFQFQESRRRLGDNANAARFFGEGSAEFLAFEVVPNADIRRVSRLVTLAAWSRHRLRFELLSDDARLSEQFDPHIVYSAGESWSAALEDACGSGAIGRTLRAMGRDAAPQGLLPSAFWQDTLQAADCGLEEVLARWEHMMAHGLEEEAAFLEALPRLGGGVAEANETELIIMASLDRPPLPLEQFPESSYLLRVRHNPGVDFHQIRTFEAEVVTESGDRTLRFRVPRTMLRGRRFQFQIGIRFHPHGWPYFEPWQFADIP